MFDVPPGRVTFTMSIEDSAAQKIDSDIRDVVVEEGRDERVAREVVMRNLGTELVLAILMLEVWLSSFLPRAQRIDPAPRETITVAA